MAKQANRKKKKYIWLIEVLVIVAVYMGVQYYNKSSVKSGDIPSIVKSQLDGTTFSTAQMTGKPFLIHFWATWCSICYLERHTIDNLAKDYHVITVASQSSRQDVKKYLAEHKLSFPVIMDEAGEIAQSFGISAFPTSILVNSKGKITFIEVGYTTEIGLRARFKML